MFLERGGKRRDVIVIYLNLLNLIERVTSLLFLLSVSWVITAKIVSVFSYACEDDDLFLIFRNFQKCIHDRLSDRAHARDGNSHSAV